MIQDILKPKSKEELLDVVNNNVIGMIDFLRLNHTKSKNILKAFAYIAELLGEKPEDLVMIYHTNIIYTYLLRPVGLNDIATSVHFRGGSFTSASVYKDEAFLRSKYNGGTYMIISRKKLNKHFFNY